MPESRHRRLSALRSAVSRSRVRVVTLSSFWPASTRSPSRTCRSTSNSSVQTRERTASAMCRPATVPRLAGGEVAGGDGVLGDGRERSSRPRRRSRSSSMATCAMSSTWTGSRPASARSCGESGVEAALQRVGAVLLRVAAAAAVTAAARGRARRSGSAGRPRARGGDCLRACSRLRLPGGFGGVWGYGDEGRSDGREGGRVGAPERVRRSGSRRTTRWRRQSVSSRSGRSSRQWQPRVSSRPGRRRPEPGRPEEVGGLPGLDARLGGLPSGPYGASAARTAASSRAAASRLRADLRTPAPPDMIRWMPMRASGAMSGRWTAAVVLLGRAVFPGAPRLRRPRRDVGRDALREDQALQEGVGGQPVRAVDTRAGDLAAGVQARHGRPAAQVGTDPAGRVVGGGGDRDRLGDRVDAVRAAGGQDRREAVLPHPGAEVPGVQVHVLGALLPHPARDAPWRRCRGGPARPVRAGHA